MANDPKRITRKDFLKLSAATAASLSMTGITGLSGCSTLPEVTLPKMNYKEGLFIKNCNIVDVINEKIIYGSTLTIINDRIAAVNEHKEAPSEKFEVIDLNNKYIIPGLIDGHCHGTLPSLNGFYPFILSDILSQSKRNYIQQIRSGVTTIRDTGALPKYLQRDLKRIKDRKITGPRIAYCNLFINIDKSHPDIDPRDVSIFADLAINFTGNPKANFSNINELNKVLDKNQETNPYFIKLTMDNVSAVCGKGKIPVYSEEHLNVIKNYAAKYNLPTASHVQTKFGFDRALKHGINSIEHTIYDAFLSDEEVMKMAKRNISNVPTMLVAHMLASEEAFKEIPSEFRNDFIDHELKLRKKFINDIKGNTKYASTRILKTNRNLLKQFRKHSQENLYSRGHFLAKPLRSFGMLKHSPRNLRKMMDAGVTVGCGTDAGIGFIYHGLIWKEMEIMNRCGLTNKEVLKCATVNNAKILNMQDKIGSIENNKFADLVVLNDNPYNNIQTYREPLMVIKEGRLAYSKGTLVKNKNIVKL